MKAVCSYIDKNPVYVSDMLPGKMYKIIKSSCPGDIGCIVHRVTTVVVSLIDTRYWITGDLAFVLEELPPGTTITLTQE